MRLVRYLASAGVASRRKCESIVRRGRVSVNHQSETNPFRTLVPSDSVQLDHSPVEVPLQKTVLMLHKPGGTVTTAADTHGRRTVMNLIPDLGVRLFPVGRLDMDTTGLLLLTDDGELAYRLTHPKYGVSKLYEATVARRLTTSDISSVSAGLDIGDGETGAVEVVNQVDSGNLVEITLRLYHGKKREIRRIFRALGIELLLLRRTSFANLELGDLPSGECRVLTQPEYKSLLKVVDLALTEMDRSDRV